MCQITPTRRSPLGAVAIERAIDGVVHRVELVIAGHDFGDFAVPVSPKTMKSLTRSSNRRRVEDSLQQHVSSSGMPFGARSSPSIVRQGMNRSRSAVSEPIRAAMPSEMTSAALVRNRDEFCALYV